MNGQMSGGKCMRSRCPYTLALPPCSRSRIKADFAYWILWKRRINPKTSCYRSLIIMSHIFTFHVLCACCHRSKFLVNSNTAGRRYNVYIHFCLFVTGISCITKTSYLNFHEIRKIGRIWIREKMIKFWKWPEKYTRSGGFCNSSKHATAGLRLERGGTIHVCGCAGTIVDAYNVL